MTRIQLETKIQAPIAVVFDASRNIDIHIKSTSQTNEKVIAGRTHGLIQINETVTWQAKHFGMWLKHQSKITRMNTPFHFTDKMIKGNFKNFIHYHNFRFIDNVTIVDDILEYELPFNYFGKLIDAIFIKKHLTNLIIHRNQYIKQHCEINLIPSLN